MIQNFTKKHRGFTLVELLVVIAIIGILASIVLVSLGGARTRAQAARVISDLNQIRTTAEIINSADGNYTLVWNNTGITTLLADMNTQTATSVLAVSNIAGYCVEVNIPGGKWGCVNSGLVVITNGAADFTNCAGTAGNGVPTGINCN